MLRVILVSILAMGVSALPASAREGFVLGWLEHVRVLDVDLRLDAKLDTGAKTSSIHAEILSDISRHDFVTDEPQTIVFRLINDRGVSKDVEARVLRWAAIKTKKGGLQHRPVVEMTFCLGGRATKGEVTLANRGHFNYEVLVGRNMLKDAGILVDSRNIFTKRAVCKSAG